jgi:hypothetical protein
MYLCRDFDKVLEKLASSLLLKLDSNLDSAVKELCDLLHLGLTHATRGECRCPDSHATRDLSRRITDHRVLHK